MSAGAGRGTWSPDIAEGSGNSWPTTREGPVAGRAQGSLHPAKPFTGLWPVSYFSTAGADPGSGLPADSVMNQTAVPPTTAAAIM